MFVVRTIVLAIILDCVYSQIQLTLPALPYAYNALEPVLSEYLMRLHHDQHFQFYTNQTNIAYRAMFNDTHYGGRLKEFSQKPIEILLTQLKDLPDTFQIGLRHYGGGYLNHKLFFQMLRTPSATVADNRPTGQLLEAIEKSFGTFDKFQELFSAAAVSLFGSGWVWIYIDSRTNHIVLNYTANQDNPIMFDKNHVVLLGIDLWEHAYSSVYESRRQEYVDNFWRIVNWPFVEQLYVEGKKQRSDL